MTTTQFALFFAAILIAYVLVHMRLARFETYLREITGLKMLNERLKGVSDVLERVRLDHVEDLLGQLHDDLLALREGQSRLEKGMGRARPSAAEADGPVLEPVQSAGARIRALVESRLLSMGYSDLRLLTDLSGVSLESETVVRVECSKANMVSKGRVVTRNGAIVDVDLTPAAQVFP